jgi:hypothetical protein
MSFSKDTTYEEPHFDAIIPLEQIEHLEGTEEQLPADQNEEDLETPHKQKAGKSHKRIRKLKKENKLLKIKVKNVEALKLKVGKLRGIIKELRKKLEQEDKAHQRKKEKKVQSAGKKPSS